jgi:OPA family glycerol-3-phosphate transporter-like MFS transporter/OPA family sugar phosphate sensor protein UhpC-like MFS transporter
MNGRKEKRNMTAEEQVAFRKGQTKFIVCSMIAYAFFYLTRKNMSMAQPAMLEEGVISTYAVGLMLSVHGIVYGLSRFVNGFWADRLNGRIFMTIGLALSALMNFCFGCSTLSILFAAFWIVNGWTQGMGFPPCAKMLTHWIHPSELATKMSIWNTSHSFGAVMALGLCSLLFSMGLGWRWCFYVPAVLAGLVAVFCFLCVKDSPREAGLPDLEIGAAPCAREERSSVTTRDRMRLVFGNRVIWLIALANFFVYIVRFGFLDWGPTFLKEFKGIPVSKGGLMIIAFEMAAVVGTIFAGWFTDKVFKGRGVRTCVIFMFFAACFAFGFWYLPKGAAIWQATLLLMGAGFCIYGPQALVGIVAANQATKEAAAMANGFAGIMGYLATTVSGIGVAFIKTEYGWGATLCSFAAFALIGMLLFLCAWTAKADGYGKKN